MKKKILSWVLAASLLISGFGISQVNNVSAANEAEPIAVDKSVNGNPVTGIVTNEYGEKEIIYGGDPSVLVDGDTVYMYVGHDNSADNEWWYNMTDWSVYSTQDMVHWNYENMVLAGTDISWTGAANNCWAAQTLKHYDPTLKMDLYYFYYTTGKSPDIDPDGVHYIGVAVSSTPTGLNNIVTVENDENGKPHVVLADSPQDKFVDIGMPLIKDSDTGYHPEANGGNDMSDIDPTAWIDVDENGEEHRYLIWGNGEMYSCELNPDMISVMDRNGDGEIKFGRRRQIYDNDLSYDIIENTPAQFKEGPYLYRRQDEDGNYYGPTYVFYSYQWREKIAYATYDGADLMNAYWENSKVIMEPTATSNTNHVAVFDFKGKTYYAYHNGSLPFGSGYRRVACVEYLNFNEDGTIDVFDETAVGVSGTKVEITDCDGNYITHEPWVNSQGDAEYPYDKDVYASEELLDENSRWRFIPGRADEEDETLVSIESNNKPGLYLWALPDAETVTFTQDTVSNKSEKVKVNDAITFRTYKALDGSDGVSFESYTNPGMFITSVDGDLVLTDGSDAKKASFSISYIRQLGSVSATLPKTTYKVGEAVDMKQLVVKANYKDDTSAEVKDYIVDGTFDTKTPGTKTVKVSYTEGDVSVETELSIKVEALPAVNATPAPTETAAPVQETKIVENKNVIYELSDNGTATAKSVVNKKTTAIVISDTVSANGKAYKVTDIEDKAFAKCSNLKSAVIGKNIIKIGKKAFFGDKKLKKVTIKSKSLKAVGKNAFKNTKSGIVFKLPKGKKAAYKKMIVKSKGLKKAKFR